MNYLITQLQLQQHESLRAQILEIERQRDTLEADIHTILSNPHPLEPGTEPLEPGPLTAILHPNYKRNTPPWRDILIQKIGKPEVEDIAIAYANRPRELSSTTVRIIDTAKAHPQEHPE